MLTSRTFSIFAAKSIVVSRFFSISGLLSDSAPFLSSKMWKPHSSYLRFAAVMLFISSPIDDYSFDVVINSPNPGSGGRALVDKLTFFSVSWADGATTTLVGDWCDFLNRKMLQNFCFKLRLIENCDFLTLAVLAYLLLLFVSPLMIFAVSEPLFARYFTELSIVAVLLLMLLVMDVWSFDFVLSDDTRLYSWLTVNDCELTTLPVDIFRLSWPASDRFFRLLRLFLLRWNLWLRVVLLQPSKLLSDIARWWFLYDDRRSSSCWWMTSIGSV